MEVFNSHFSTELQGHRSSSRSRRSGGILSSEHRQDSADAATSRRRTTRLSLEDSYDDSADPGMHLALPSISVMQNSKPSGNT